MTDAAAFLMSGRRAIDVGRDGLDAVRAALEAGPLAEAFAAAGRVILEAPGRVVFVGVGKSGHVGAKLAATFASTGTPAFFVHATEASHGDLGMILAGDVLVVLSWSGETKELSDVVAHSRRFSVPLIGITGGASSMLARAADVALVLPKVAEACPHNLAPTTSTLMQLALGDALAVALLEARGFTAENFRALHPGGKLGAGLTPVRDLMARGNDLPLVALGASVGAALEELTLKSRGIVGVLGPDGALAGVFTDGDVRRYMQRTRDLTVQAALWEAPVERAMTRAPVTTGPDTLAASALALMQARKITAVFVLEDGRPTGLVTFLQLLQAGAA